jgi:GT2 family glycosyltransferase
MRLWRTGLFALDFRLTTEKDDCTQGSLPLTLSFVVLTYNTRDFLRDCLNSILAECRSLASGLVSCRVVTVDNASSDGTYDMVQDEFPSVRLIRHSKNLGSAKGFNAGVAQAVPESDILVIMNSDIIILPGTINKMLTFLKEHKEVDGVSCALYNPDMTPQRTRTSIVRILPQDKSKPFRAGFPGTGFAMYRAETFLRVGGYDETYYFYNEDLDWAARAKRLGCVFYFLPDASAIHIGGGGRRHNVSGILKELYRSNLYFYRRHYPRLAWLAYLILRAEIAVRIRGIERQISRLQSNEGLEEYEQQIAILREAKRRMQEEYRKPSTPQIPRFAG